MTEKPSAQQVSDNPPPTALTTRLFDSLLKLYRRTIKRVYPLHIGAHWLISHTIIPALEAIKGFKTVSDDPFWFRLELLLKQHEAETVQQIEQLVQPGMVVLDIGAHIGYYSRIFGQLVGNGGRVLAFEPHPHTFATLRRNTRRQMHVQLHQVAASDTRQETQLYDYLLMSASGSLHYDETLATLQRQQASEYAVAPRMQPNFTAKTYTVQAVVLDDFLEALGIQAVDFIKMDIEGAELNALYGMQKIIQQSKNLYLIMEFNPKALQAFGHDPQQVIPTVLALGFDSVLTILQDGSTYPLATEPAILGDLVHNLEQNLGVINLLFIRAQR